MESDNIAQAGTQQGNIGEYVPEAEHRRSFISLRWMVVILASYLTLFSHLSSPNFPVFFIFAILFAAANVGLAFVRPELFEQKSTQWAIAACDVVFICGTLFLLQVPNTYLYV